MESVYLETTFISYLVALPSRDLIVAAHQQVTHDWWATRRDLFRCCVSQVVIDEASAGDPSEIEKRLAVIADLPILEASPEAENLAARILSAGVLPARAVRDAAHIAIAAVHNVDYLLTWNCKHLANAQIAKQVEKVCHMYDQGMPAICTPEELMGE
jgi:hypothetical protein